MGWIAVDLDGTLAEYHGWPADGSIGKPIPLMVERVKGWVAEGKDVRIFTARIWPLGTDEAWGIERRAQVEKQVALITEWCQQHVGQSLPVTCVKDHKMIQLWDDRAIQMLPNTGQTVGEALGEEKGLGKETAGCVPQGCGESSEGAD